MQAMGNNIIEALRILEEIEICVHLAMMMATHEAVTFNVRDVLLSKCGSMGVLNRS